MGNEQDMVLVDKWANVIDDKKYAPVVDESKRKALAALLENQAVDLKKNSSVLQELNEAAPTNVSGGVSKWDPVVMGMVRRSIPSLIAFDVAGVQPLSMPTGLIFALRARYDGQAGDEALWNEANSSFSGTGTQSDGAFADAEECTTTTGSATVTTASTAGLSVGMLVIGVGIPANAKINTITDATDFVISAVATASGTVNLAFAATAGGGVSTATGEGDITAQMGVSIEKVSIDVQTRALKAEYSLELAQDMMAVHGLNAEQELTNILGSELVSEQNREFLRKIYGQAKLGAVKDTVTPGIFDLQADTDGRWAAERFKGLHFQIERDCNGILTDTRRGRGNILIVSADIASTLATAKILDLNSLQADLSADWSQSTQVGTIGGRIKVYVDPYAVSDFYFIGYKGSSPTDAGYFYAPYVPLQLLKAQDPNSFQPKLAFKTRYGQIANPFFNGGTRQNGYYRIAAVRNIV